MASIRTSRKIPFTRVVAGLLTLMASGTVFANHAALVHGEPMPFDNFTADQGLIDVPCPASWTNNSGIVLPTTCSTPTISDGMYQREVTVSGSGDSSYDGTYIQFIMTEQGASGDGGGAYFSTERGSLNFVSQDFVKMNNRGEGIASNQTILESKVKVISSTEYIEERFEISTSYKTGWGQNAGSVEDMWVNIDQASSEIRYYKPTELAPEYLTLELFDERINVKSDGSALNSTRVEISQRLAMEEEKNNPLTTGAQKFKHTTVRGFFVNLDSDFFGILNLNPVLPGGTNGGNLVWEINDTLAATYVGISTPEANNILFGFTRYENKSTLVDNETKLRTFTNAEAGGGIDSGTGRPLWDNIVRNIGGSITEPLFGAAELISEITAVSATAFSLQDPVVLLGAANPNYEPNSDIALLAAVPLDLDLYSANAYDAWEVTAGVFSAVGGGEIPCPGVSCSPPSINENGLYQRQVLTASGAVYYQTIMVDGAVTGAAVVLKDKVVQVWDPGSGTYIDKVLQIETNVETSPGVFEDILVDVQELDSYASLRFKSETYVLASNGGSEQGLASRMHIADFDLTVLPPESEPLPNDYGVFINDVEQNLGWANRGQYVADVNIDANHDGIILYGEQSTKVDVDATMRIGQTVRIHDASGNDVTSMEEIFTMDVGNGVDREASKRLVHTSRVGTQAGGTGFSDPIQFKSVTVSGQYQRTSSLVGDPFQMVGDGTLASPTGDTLLWDVGDTLQATWMAGEYYTFVSNEKSIVGTTSFANLTDITRVAYTTTEVPTNADESWLLDPFGEAPYYPSIPPAP